MIVFLQKSLHHLSQKNYTASKPQCNITKYSITTGNVYSLLSNGPLVIAYGLFPEASSIHCATYSLFILNVAESYRTCSLSCRQCEESTTEVWVLFRLT